MLAMLPHHQQSYIIHIINVINIINIISILIIYYYNKTIFKKWKVKGYIKLYSQVYYNLFKN